MNRRVRPIFGSAGVEAFVEMMQDLPALPALTGTLPKCDSEVLNDHE